MWKSRLADTRSGFEASKKRVFTEYGLQGGRPIRGIVELWRLRKSAIATSLEPSRAAR